MVHPEICHFRPADAPYMYLIFTDTKIKEAKTRPVIVPIGSTEQHGQHLPIGTDAVLATRVISDSDSVRSAIGQGTNNYTVSQINRYVTAVANRGTVYSLSLIDKTTDSNGKLIKDYTPEVVNQMDEISSSTWDLVHNGMESMVKSSSTFIRPAMARFCMV